MDGELQDVKIYKSRISGCWLGIDMFRKEFCGSHSPVRAVMSDMKDDMIMIT